MALLHPPIHTTGRSLRLGIIGAGGIVEDVHLPVLMNVACAKVRWVADLDAARARRVAGAFGVSAVSSSNLDVLPEVDVILLAVPYGARSSYFEALRPRQRAIYVEKPFARTLAEHDRLCSWFGPGKIADGFQRRSWGPVAAIAELVKSAPFGALRLARFGLGGPGITIGNRYASNFELAGGGILFEVGVHGIDFLLHLFEAKGVAVLERKMEFDDRFDVHTEARLTIDRPKDCPLECEIVVSSLRATSNAIELVFDHATVTFSMFQWTGLHVKTKTGTVYSLADVTPPRPLTIAQTFHRHWSTFLEGCMTGMPNHTSASCSRMTTYVIEQLYDSAG